MDLKSHRFISYFEPEQAAQLCQVAILESFPDGGVIFEEGEISDCLYLVLAGQVAVSKRIASDKYQAVAVAGPNDFFGEFGVLDGKPRSARAIACGETSLAKVAGDRLMEILQNTKSPVAINLFGYIIQRVRATTEEYVNEVIHKEKMVMVGEMVNSIMHDFKNPFAGIYLASVMLKELHPDRQSQEYCELIQAQIQRMLRMADEVLEFARGSPVLDRQPVNLVALLEQFQKLNRAYFEYAKVELATRVENLAVSADENKLMRVWQNLVTNAVEAFKGRGGRVEITATAAGEWAEINISDNGPGIPEAIRSRLFEPFVTYGKGGGTGLGTAIAKSIIDAHGGEIYFQSETGVGTTFYIRLPLLKT